MHVGVMYGNLSLWKLSSGGGWYLPFGGGGTNDSACVSMHALGGSGGMLPRKNFIIRCSEIASEAILLLKFTLGLDAAHHVQGLLSYQCMCSSDGV